MFNNHKISRIVILSIFTLFLFLPTISHSQLGTDVEVFQIHYQNATDFEGAVKAVLSGSGTVTIVKNANAIVVRDYRYNLKLAREVIAKLDIHPKTIYINVEFVEEEEFLLAGIKIKWRAANSGFVVGNIARPGAGTEIVLNAKMSSLKIKRKQILTILENRRGTIFVGKSVPLSEYYLNYGVNNGYISQGTTFKNAGTSFSVTARTLPNKKIKVSITPEVSYYDTDRRIFAVKNAFTEVVINDPGKAVIASSEVDNDSFGSKFLLGAQSGKKKSKFVIILSARSK